MLDLITQYFKTYYVPWWSHLLGNAQAQESVRLFNRTAITDIDLSRLPNLLWPDQPGERSLNHFEHFFTHMIRVPKAKGGDSGAPGYLALLAHAADRYIDDTYKRTGSLED